MFVLYGWLNEEYRLKGTSSLIYWQKTSRYEHDTTYSYAHFCHGCPCRSWKSNWQRPLLAKLVKLRSQTCGFTVWAGAHKIYTRCSRYSRRKSRLATLWVETCPHYVSANMPCLLRNFFLASHANSLLPDFSYFSWKILIWIHGFFQDAGC